ncbi:MAG: transposase [Candidatus Moranbacteria bacterium RIFOXYA12_FULL_35_19]|nr:MAG: transposase [Candidatus Moranbacteria bacterium RIFOXYC12_FULL_36_13]OGI33106.1 MAG: transposase [Candidatus Moranbacteria bacterium RIFOXYB12_FULL_35_8]OGI35527.1 MAG: transposase [Candidatus Moranbacteria bacterium RIFOXYA12_FULL_35_19]
MSNLYQSLSHSKWNCKYHLIFVPKKRKSVIYGKIRIELKKILHELATQKESKITEGSLSIDHVHMCIEIPPKYAVASVIGFLKGKSAIAIARMQGKDRNYTGAHFWARGYAVLTIGFDEEIIKKYVREQSIEDDNFQTRLIN